MYSRFSVPLLAAALVWTSPALADETADVAGHYYLQGVHETGSELLLMPDGRFQWYMSYGAVDQNADGTWTRKGKVVTLKAQGADRSKPLFRLDEQIPWEASHERQLREKERDAKVAAVIKACPLLEGTAIAMSPPLMRMETPDKATLIAEAQAAERAEKDARTKAETAASDAVAKLGLDGSDDRVDDARQAINDWQVARSKMQDAFGAASLAAPPRNDLRLPPACTFPPEVRVDDAPPDLWKGGIIIGIADPEMGVAPKGVAVTLTWADGHKEVSKTASRGWALFQRRAGVKAGHVEIDPPFATWGKAAFDFPPLEKGLQAFTMDAQQVIAAPFETMTLRLDGEDLVPEDMGRGRYVKGGGR